MVALYADENVSHRVVRGLRRRGLDVVTAQDAALTGTVDDTRHLELATALQRVLITADDDFLPIAARWAAEGRAHPGILHYRMEGATIGGLVNEVSALALDAAPASLASRVVYLKRR